MTYKVTQTHKIKALYHTPIYVPALKAECNYFCVSGNVAEISGPIVDGSYIIDFKNGDRISISPNHVIAVHFEKISFSSDTDTAISHPNLPKINFNSNT